MTELKDTIAREIQELETWRDRLRVRAHLLKSEMRDTWMRIEGHWPEIEQKFRELDKPSRGAFEELGKSLKGMLGEIRADYRRIEEQEAKG